ncbi:MAG: prepilin-type N-terminal cleavage/methylation domain-containing protein [Alphaproteobacteria bacterium]
MKKSGFTLIELSIVLIIVSLIISGVIVGSSLIEANRIRNLISSFNNYQSAINVFRTKYDSLPGDMNNATQFFTSSSLTINNGNGDGKITWGDTGTQKENLYAWQHLALAGIIKGTYTGTSSTPYFNLGVNIPEIRNLNAGFDFAYNNKNILSIGSPNGAYTSATTAQLLNGPILTTNIAYGIDNKMDDGNPSTGNIITKFGNNITSGCISSDGLSYIFSDNTVSCISWYLFY